MALRLVTLDCANTLLRDSGPWDPTRFALEAARATGLCLPRRATEVYKTLLRSRYPAILHANGTGDGTLVRAEYVRLGEAWLRELDLDPSLAPKVVDEGVRLLPSLYEPFPDTAPFLVEARARGLRLAVVSNWDVTLPEVLAYHGLLGLVDKVYASLVVGAEKPDPTMIHLAMAALGALPEETLHVGDDPHDDLGAATNAGVHGALIDRTGLGVGTVVRPWSSDISPIEISSLMEVLDWTA